MSVDQISVFCVMYTTTAATTKQLLLLLLTAAATLRLPCTDARYLYRPEALTVTKPKSKQ